MHTNEPKIVRVVTHPSADTGERPPKVVRVVTDDAAGTYRLARAEALLREAGFVQQGNEGATG